ncbi:MAG: chaperone modulator CbpM [Halioglobus sp.]
MKGAWVRVSAMEFCECEGVHHNVVVELVELNIATPVEGEQVQDWVFDDAGARWLRKALRLQRELELDWIAIGMLIDLMREREQLRRENAGLQRALARFLVD